MEDSLQKFGHGGARAGAGRKPGLALGPLPERPDAALLEGDACIVLAQALRGRHVTDRQLSIAEMVLRSIRGGQI
jgi:hypothetical protein